MRDPMIKRIPRELKHDIGKYIALFVFLTVMTGFISGFIIGDESLKARYDSGFSEFRVEDGHFVLENEATDEMLAKVRNTGVEVYPLFYKDEKVSLPGTAVSIASGDSVDEAAGTDKGGKAAADGDTARIFINRKEVDLADFWEGREPETADEIALDRLYMKNNGLKTGSVLIVGGRNTRSPALWRFQITARFSGTMQTRCLTQRISQLLK